MAPNELVIPVTVGPLGFATYFVSNLANRKDSAAEEILAVPSNTETKDPIILQNDVSTNISVHLRSIDVHRKELRRIVPQNGEQVG
jgi:hypothetical protein